jgi:lipoprotein-anchoring transpeptidase ErfK/SrfK
LAWLVLFFWLVLVIGAGVMVMGARALWQGDMILPGVQTLGVDLSGKSTAQAERMLQNAWAERRVALAAGDQSWTLPAEQLGLKLDAEGTARLAHRQGRNTADADEAIDAALQLVASTLQRTPSLQAALSKLDPRLAAVQQVLVTPVIAFDRRQAADAVRSLAQQLEIAPQDATVSVEEGQVVTTAALPGQALDVAAAIGALEAGAARLNEAASFDLSLPIVALEPTLTDVSAVVNEVAPLLSQPITIDLWDPVRDERLSWLVSPQEAGHWLAFEPLTTEAGKITWRVDEEKVAAYLDAQQEALGQDRYIDRQKAIPMLVDAFLNRTPGIALRIQHFDRTHVVESGETISSIGAKYGVPYPWILKSNPKLGDMLSVGQEIVIPSPDALLPLPPVPNKRIKISIGKQHMQAFEDGDVKFDWVVSTGLPGSPTSPGVFQVQTHEEMAYADQWDLNMPFFMGIYKPAPDSTVMNGFHGFPSKDKKQLLWTKNLGRPVTYGCVLLSTENAETLYKWAEEGVIVEITA